MPRSMFIGEKTPIDDSIRPGFVIKKKVNKLKSTFWHLARY